MPMKRTTLLEKLNLVAPALGDHEIIPILTHFWFTGSALMAYNDRIAISTPLTTSFKGAVPGKTLLGLMTASRAKDIELLPTGDNLEIRGAGKYKLGLLSEENFAFTMPDVKAIKDWITPSPDLKKAIGSCLRAVNNDATIPEQLGITFVPCKDGIELYSTNNSTLCHAFVKTNKIPKTRVILPGSFCQQYMRLIDRGEQGRLAITENYVLLVSGTEQLFGRLIETTSPIDFTELMGEHMDGVDDATFLTIPANLRLILERAILITEDKQDKTTTVVSVQNGEMRFVSKSSRGEFTDRLKVPAHPEVNIRLDPKLLKNGLGDYEQMLITERCAIMRKGAHVYLVSASET